MKKKIAKVGLIFLCILLSLKNNLYAYMMTSEEEIQNYNIVNVMIICFFVIITFLMVVYAIYTFTKLRKKDDDNSEENETDKIDKYSEEINVSDENQIRYLVATFILLLPVLFIVYMLIITGFAPIGLLILAALLIYNCLKKYTHLERFYHNAKIFLVIIVVFLIYKYISIFM